MTNWQKIVSQHSDSLRRTAWRLLGNHADVSECLQEAFLAALEVSRRKSVRNWRALLHWLVVRRAIDRLRQRMTESTRHEQLAISMTVVRPNPGPAQQAETAELVANLRKSLTKLPPLQAQAFCLRYISDLSYRDIGRTLDMKISTVGSALHRARSQLRSLLEDSAGRKH